MPPVCLHIRSPQLQHLGVFAVLRAPFCPRYSGSDEANGASLHRGVISIHHACHFHFLCACLYMTAAKGQLLPSAPFNLLPSCLLNSSEESTFSGSHDSHQVEAQKQQLASSLPSMLLMVESSWPDNLMVIISVDVAQTQMNDLHVQMSPKGPFRFPFCCNKMDMLVASEQRPAGAALCSQAIYICLWPSHKCPDAAIQPPVQPEGIQQGIRGCNRPTPIMSPA